MNADRDQGIVEQFNRTLGGRFFTFQYSPEMNFKEGKRSTEWVKRLSEVVLALNSEVTRLTGKKPFEVIKEKVVDTKSSTTYSRSVGLKEKRQDPSKNARYLYAAGELEGGKFFNDFLKTELVSSTLRKVVLKLLYLPMRFV